MPDITLGFILGLFINASMVVLAVYLTYVKLNRIPVLKKYKLGTPEYKGYSKIYSQEFLIIALINAGLALIRTGLGIFESIRDLSPLTVSIAFLVQFCASVVAVYFVYKLFVKKS